MKKSTAIIGWVLTVTLALAAFANSGPGILLTLVAAVLVCPAFRIRVELPGKVWIPAVVLLVCAASFFAPRGPEVPSGPQVPSVEAASSAPAELDVEPESDVAADSSSGSSAPSDGELSEADAFPFHVTFYEQVNNDVTGNWRLALVAESGLSDIQDYALPYYRSYFKDDSEIHFIVNFTLKTTTRVTCDSGLLFVSVYDYVDGEEHDAKVMPSGTQLASYTVSLSDGSVEDVFGG